VAFGEPVARRAIGLLRADSSDKKGCQTTQSEEKGGPYVLLFKPKKGKEKKRQLRPKTGVKSADK